MMQSIEDICYQAMQAGARIDLRECHYGQTTKPEIIIKRPTHYYSFLAGFVKTQRMFSILEIGTNSGGSILAMYKGLAKEDNRDVRLVTVDIQERDYEVFSKEDSIEQVVGDSLDRRVTQRVVSLFKENIDLLYIDSLHEYEHTKSNIEIYSKALNPRYIILDDIRQCGEMEKLWAELKKELGENTYDASEICRRPGAGFGVILWRREES